MWQRSFFYVENTREENLIGLPTFVTGPLTPRLNWGQTPGKRNKEVNLANARVNELIEEGLTGDDLVATFISRRVCPLQRLSTKSAI